MLPPAPLFTCWLPSPPLLQGGNRLGANKSAKAAAHRSYGAACMWSLFEHFGRTRPAPVAVPVWLRLVEETPHEFAGQDFDNLVAASKKAIDALVKAGVLKDDNRRWVRGVSAQHEVIPTLADKRLRVELWPVDAVTFGAVLVREGVA